MRDLGDYIDFDEAERLISSANNIGEQMVIALLWRCGLRAFEIGRLKKKHLDTEEGVLIVEGKGGKAARVPVEPELLGWLKWAADQIENPEDYLLEGKNRKGVSRITVWRIVKRVAKKAGINITKSNRPLHPHSLRHSLAIWLVKMGVPLPKIQQILRHSSLVPTTYYLQFSTKELAEDYLLAWEKARRE
jgi:integrase/recombinase XerD